MTDYTELVKALRHCTDNEPSNGYCWNCPYQGEKCHTMLSDAAAAIEELDAEETRLLLITSELQDKVVELEEQLNDAEIAADDNGRQVEALQADIKRLKEANDELREAQTYINHYGDRWMTSAKDVPSAAYEHGYADGMAEVKAQLPKRGEWSEENRRPRSSQFVCSVCHRTAYDPQPTRDKAWRKRCRYAYCPNCGAKMEVQE